MFMVELELKLNLRKLLDIYRDHLFFFWLGFDAIKVDNVGVTILK